MASELCASMLFTLYASSGARFHLNSIDKHARSVMTSPALTQRQPANKLSLSGSTHGRKVNLNCTLMREKKKLWQGELTETFQIQFSECDFYY